MKYALRTVTWRFQETNEALPEIKSKASVYIRSPEDLFASYASLFKDHVRERFVVFWLDASNKVTGWEIITEGLLNSSLCHPREVFRGAIVATAASIIVAHNHPSNNTEPSREDIEITKQLV
jgi:DNA repair protein RadC